MFEFFDALVEFGELGKDHGHATGLADGHRGTSQHRGLVGDAVDDPGLRPDDHVVADFQVPCDSRLPRHRDMMPDGGAAREAALGDKQGVGADLNIMSERDERPELGSFADHGAARAAARIDGRSGADFAVVFDHRVADLRNLVMDALVRGEAIPVLADGAVGVKDHAVANNAVIINYGVGIEDTVPPDLGAGTDIDSRINHGPFADRGSRIDVGGGRNAVVRVLAVTIQLNHRQPRRRSRGPWLSAGATRSLFKHPDRR